MADRYQNRLFSSDDRDRGGDQRRSGQAESDPLAELARLIGQSDTFAAPGRANARPSASARPPETSWESPDHYEPQAESIEPESYSESYQDPSPGWIRRANVQPQPAPLPPQEYPAEQAWHDQGHESVEAGLGYHQQSDFSRYDDALYDQIETGEQSFQGDREYPDDAYAYQDDYPEEEVHQDKPENRRRGGMKLVAAILAFAFVGTGSAITYKKYIGPRHHVDPPTIIADNTPTKIVPAPSDGAARIPDQSADTAERMVSREEAPIDVDATSANPRVVMPTSSQSVNPTVTPPSDARRVRTVVIQGPTDGTAPQGAVPQGTTSTPQGAASTRSVAAPRNPAASANASANQPLSLAPQTAQARQQVATAAPTAQVAPTAAAESGYLVSISSQDSEAVAKESFRVAQGKYPSVLGSHSVVVRRVELPDGKVKYRAMVGPYRTRAEAVQFCTELKAAGGQCFIP